MSYKLWVVKICMALSALVLLAVSLVFYYNAVALLLPSFWEFYWLSILLQIFAGSLLEVTPEVFVNSRGVKFSSKDFIVFTIIPIIILIYSWGWWNAYWKWWYREISLYTPIASIWLGIAIGKAVQKT